MRSGNSSIVTRDASPIPTANRTFSVPAIVNERERATRRRTGSSARLLSATKEQRLHSIDDEKESEERLVDSLDSCLHIQSCNALWSAVFVTDQGHHVDPKTRHIHSDLPQTLSAI
jgi:hypothetical protein